MKAANKRVEKAILAMSTAVYNMQTAMITPKKITPAKREKIKRHIDNGWESAKIARRFNVSVSQVAGIKAWHKNSDSWRK